MMSHGQEAGIPMQAGVSHFVIVTLGQRLFAIDADAVQGIEDVPEGVTRPVPGFQGDLYEVLDLTSRLTISDTPARQLGQIVLLVLDQRRGSVGVERVHGRMDLQASQILSLPQHFQGAERDWYRGMILFENSVVLILNLSWVFHSNSEGMQNRYRISPRSMSTAGPDIPRNEC